MFRLVVGLRRLLRMPRAEVGDQYSIWVGLTYVFNLIVGTGALTLPSVFARAGWALGTLSILFLAFMSLVNATYVVETMACANAVIKWRRLQTIRRSSLVKNDYGESSDESTPMHRAEGSAPLVPASAGYYTLDWRVELGEMANIFFNSVGRLLFYITLCVYLYGDLSIYSAAVANSIKDVVCTYRPGNDSDNLPGGLACLGPPSPAAPGLGPPEARLTRTQVYRGALLAFTALLGPFVFCDVQKTKYLQLATTLMRWLAFVIMISMAINLLIRDGPQGKPPAFDITGMPTLFGACVYSYMCHHSLPGLIAPIKRKSKLCTHLSLDYLLISMFYLLLAFTGAFAFAQLNDLYTLNFVPSSHDNFFLEIIEYFLSLFPVFTLSASYPIIAITLKNNLQSLVLDMSAFEEYNVVVRKMIFPFFVVLPPFVLTYYVEDIHQLIEFTGSYAGTGIQYLIPTILVLCARKSCANLLGSRVYNKYESPFKHVAWAVFVLVWAGLCVILVSVHFVEEWM